MRRLFDIKGHPLLCTYSDAPVLTTYAYTSSMGDVDMVIMSSYILILFSLFSVDVIYFIYNF